MEPLIINSAEVLQNINTDRDVFISSECSFFGILETTGRIIVSFPVTFHENVTCRDLVIADDVKNRWFQKKRVIFLQNLICESVETNGGLCVNGVLNVSHTLRYDGYNLEFGEFFLCGKLIDKVNKGNKALGVTTSVENIPDLFTLTDAITGPVPLSETSLAVIPKEETALVDPEAAYLFCDNCQKDAEIQRIQGNTGEILLCFDCCDLIIENRKEPHATKRIPAPWENQYLSDDELAFLAKHGYVTCPEKFPEEPFVHVKPQSIEGKLSHKEIVVVDPQFEYLTEYDVERYTKKITYNGGPVAYLVQGISMVGAAFVAGQLVPVIGGYAAFAAFVASTPVTWRGSKSLTNVINEKVILPREVRVRKQLLEGRKKDERASQDSEIYYIGRG